MSHEAQPGCIVWLPKSRDISPRSTIISALRDGGIAPAVFNHPVVI